MKVMYCVTTKIFKGLKVTATIKTVNGDLNPKDTFREEKGVDVYEEIYETRHEAEIALKEAKACNPKKTRFATRRELEELQISLLRQGS